MPNILNLKKQIKTEEKREEKETKSTDNNFHSLKWTALEFTKYQKDFRWFMIGGLIALGFLIFALINKNFIFALLIILAAFSLYIWGEKEPRKIKFAITAKGIMIENTCYDFDNLKSFWIFFEPPEIKYLSLESKKLFMPYLKIPLGDENPNRIREMLLKFLPEVRQEESLIDILARHLRF